MPDPPLPPHFPRLPHARPAPASTLSTPPTPTDVQLQHIGVDVVVVVIDLAALVAACVHVTRRAAVSTKYPEGYPKNISPYPEQCCELPPPPPLLPAHQRYPSESCILPPPCPCNPPNLNPKRCVSTCSLALPLLAAQPPLPSPSLPLSTPALLAVAPCPP